MQRHCLQCKNPLLQKSRDRRQAPRDDALETLKVGTGGEWNAARGTLRGHCCTAFHAGPAVLVRTMGTAREVDQGHGLLSLLGR
jgi:hypothetical protein